MTSGFTAAVAPPPDEYPYLTRALHVVMADHDYSFADEFDYGLELILDGFAQRLSAGDT